jgi:hypothetical protein
MTIRSELGAGSTFAARIPIAPHGGEASSKNQSEQ